MPTSSQPFRLLAKPTGSACNLDCAYCFYLEKQALYPASTHRMSDATLEAYIRQLLSDSMTEVTIAWQGGEPTLMGLDFFRRAVGLAQRHKRPEQRIEHTIQTNGVLLDDEWCGFFKEHGFLVGLSIDGPQALHDAYRRDRGGQGTFPAVMRAAERLQRHGVAVNVLCTVNTANQDHGRRVYRFFRDELRAGWMQFIPIVERQAAGGVTERSVGPVQYGRFLVEVYEEWLRRDVGRVSVQMFDVALHAFFGQHPLCVHAPTCGRAPILEHNGDVYACDHFVDPRHLLGNFHDVPLRALVASAGQRAFGEAKRGGLTAQCRACDVAAACNGGCPKDRFVPSRDGEAGHNYLCEGLYLFFKHVQPTMARIARLVQAGADAAQVMQWVRAEDAKRGRNDACPCGSGRKFRKCHG